MSVTPECGGDAAAYVLGALDPQELNGFTRHLHSCSICQTEIESLRQTVGALPTAAPQFPASKSLKREIMREVRADARLQPARAEVSGRERIASFGRGTVPRFRAGTGFRPGFVYGIAALVLVLAVVIAGVTAAGTSKKAGTQVVSASVGHAKVIVGTSRDELIVHKLARLSGGQVYEVWLESSGGTPQPTGTTFNTDADGHGDVTVADNLKGADKLLVTREPAGGRVHPSGNPVVVSAIS
jgi:hypothetical protein